MTVRDVVHYPDRLLKAPSADAPADEAARRQLADDLLETMAVAPGCVGLAAVQIGEATRAFSLDVSVMKKPPEPNHGRFVLFDPELIHATGSEVGREGCLSVPDFTCNVRRATEILVQGTNVDGTSRVIRAEGFEARALQHELDHLAGMLILDRAVSFRTDVFRRKNYANKGEHLK